MSELNDALERARRIARVADQMPAGLSGSDRHFLAHLVTAHGQSKGQVISDHSIAQWRDWHDDEHQRPQNHGHGV